MAIERGDTFGVYQFCSCSALSLSNANDIRNYLYALIKGNIRFRNADVYEQHEYVEVKYLMENYQTINIFCDIINDTEHISLNIEDFDLCIHKILDYIFTSCKLKNIIDKFMMYACKLYYSHNKKKKEGQIENKNELRKEYRIRIKKILSSDEKNSQLFMEYLDHYYYKYLDEKYAPFPSGKGYIKTKKHFESTVTKVKSKESNIVDKAMNNIAKR
jgi:ABC-type antimicrobial peptide transport system permease subunit